MQGEYVVKIGDKTFEYTDANDIPEKFDHLIKFVPKEPPEPHSQEDHDTLILFLKNLEKYLREDKKIINASGY